MYQDVAYSSSNLCRSKFSILAYAENILNGYMLTGVMSILGVVSVFVVMGLGFVVNIFLYKTLEI